MGKKISCAFFLVFFARLAFLAAAPRFTCVCSQESGDVFLAADTEGFVSQCANGSCQRIQRTILPIAAIAASPVEPVAAIYETDGFMTHRILVWNFALNEDLFSVDVGGRVSSLSFSGKGAYLLACGDFAGAVRIFRVKDSKEVPLATKGLSDVTFAMMNEKENTVVSYSARGVLTYFGVLSGRAKTTVETEADLQGVFASRNAIALAGTKENSIYKLKTSSGETEFLVKDEGCAHFIWGDFLMTFAESEGNLALFSHAASESNGVETSLVAFFPTECGAPIFAEKTKNFVFFASADKISAISASILTGQSEGFAVEETVFSPFDYAKIIDFAEYGGKIFFLTEEGLFSADFSDGEAKFLIGNDGKKNVYAAENTIALWSKNLGNSARIYDFDGENLSFECEVLAEKPLLSIEIEGGIASTFDEGKNILVYELAQRKELFSLHGDDFEAVTGDGENAFIGKTKSTQPRSALVSYNYGTKVAQIVKIPGEIVLWLARRKSNIYGLSCKNISEGEYCAFLFNQQNQKGAKTFVFSAFFETEPAMTAFGNSFYCNCEKDSITKFDLQKNASRKLPRLSAFPQKIAASSEMIMALTAGGTLGFYDATADSLIGEWKILKGGAKIERLR